MPVGPAIPLLVSDLLRGNGAAFLGDSITQRDGLNDSGISGSGSWGVMACMASGQRIRFVRNAGISGDNTTQMLARLNADVIAYQPDVCFILGGTNDIGQGVAQSTIRANLTAIYNRLRAARIQPIACTVTPRTATTGNYEIEKLNAWMRAYCGRHGIWVADLADAVTDPTTFGWLGGGTVYNVDGLHPNDDGSRLMANRAVSDVAALLPNAAPYLTHFGDSTTSGANLLKQGLFMADANSDGVADNWTNTGPSTGITHSRESVTGVLGKMQVATVTVANTRTYDQVVAGTWAVGDRIAFSGLFTTTGCESGGMTVSAGVLFTNGASPNQLYPLRTFTRDVTLWRFHAEAIIPAGTTALTARLTMTTSGTGVVKWGQITLLNLTSMEIT